MPIADLPFVDDALKSIEADAEAEGWDCPAQLYAMCAENVSPEMGAITVSSFFGFDLAMYLTGYSYHALKAIARALPTAPQMVRDEWAGLIGLVLVDETWSIQQKDGEPRPTGSLAEHPDRIESRFVWLAAADGSSRVLTRRRGGEPEFVMDWSSGRLVDATREVLALALRS